MPAGPNKCRQFGCFVGGQSKRLFTLKTKAGMKFLCRRGQGMINGRGATRTDFSETMRETANKKNWWGTSLLAVLACT